MGHEAHLLLNVAVAVAIALVGGLLAHRLRQSVIIGYLLAGVAIGPFTPGFIGDRAQIAALAEIGVIFLMFALGIEFSLKELAAVRAVAVVGTSAQVLLTIGAGFGLGLALGWPPLEGLVFGGVIAISSTMVILKILIDRGEVAAQHGRVLLGMLIVQDLLAVLLIVVLPQLVGSQHATLAVGALTLVKAGGFIAVTLLLGTRVVPRLMARIERLGSPELFLLTAVALALGSATASALLGLSPALGAFLAGLLLTETEFDHRVVAEVVPMRNLFATLFFVSVGMLIDPGFIWANLAAVLGLAAFIIVAKALITLGVVLPARLGGRTAAFTALGLIQIGEFSYLLAEAGRSSGALSPRLHALVLTSSLVTIVLTPFAFSLAPRVERALGALPGLGDWLRPTPSKPEGGPVAAEPVIVVGYGRVGRQVVAGLRAGGLPVLVIEEDLHLVREITRQGIAAVYGDATHPGIVAAARAERARLVVVALPDAGATQTVVHHIRRANPRAPILARVAREEYEERVRRAGATALVAPERAGALLLLEESARALALPVAAVTDLLFTAEPAPTEERSPAP